MRIVLEQSAELAQPAFAAQLLHELAEHADIQSGAGSGGFNRVARLRMRFAQRSNGLFRQFRGNPELTGNSGNINVPGHLAHDSIQQTHECDSICKGAAYMPAKHWSAYRFHGRPNANGPAGWRGRRCSTE
ncbi:hypothetical protein [Novosphingobium sp.]|uniref:hypothetical protein n=1 Tax=Novosphingobium sp. TaxID=1874826 RepID=UPI0027362C5D|nr:hypothetical protein [Novosphingobium sp.]MDP3906944.1 hypothetical protein [Novosphingobium sp.]